MDKQSKFNAKKLATLAFLGVLSVGITGIASAQQVPPTGGDGFETAVEIDPGSYEGAGLMEKGVKEYFYINVKPGQELKLNGTFKAFSDAWGEEELALYNEDRKQLAKEVETLDKGEQASFSFSWLSSSDKDPHKYYIKRECTWHKIELLSLDISLVDRYDAGSQTDAGDTVEKAIEITSGEYDAYLSGKTGADVKDFYKVAVQKGKTLTVKVTPPNEATMKVVIYDKNRKSLKDEYASNPGAIVTSSLAIAKSEDVFVSVICDRYCSEDLVAYTLDITTEGEAIEEDEGEEGVLYYGTEGEADEKKGSNWGLIMGVIAGIIIFATIVYLLLKKKKRKK